MELQRFKIFTTYVVPIIGSVGSALDVIGDTGACISMVFLSLAIAIVSRMSWKKDKDLAKALLCCVIILLVIPSVGLIIIHSQQKDIEILNKSLASSPRGDIEMLRERADGGDGPAQYKMAEYYMKQREYDKSREYARAAADKGNPRAYMLLAEHYTLGLGCSVDYSRAISNILNAMRYAVVDYDYIIRYMQEHGYEVGEFDKLALTQAKAEYEWLFSLWTEVPLTLSGKGREAALRMLNDNYRKILQLSAKGYIHAVELLFIREYLTDPNQSEKMFHFAQQLYNVDHIPTGSFARRSFFDSYYWDKHDSMPTGSDAIDRYIRDNDYYMYSLLEKGADDTIPLSNGLLVADYRFDRARYEWYSRIMKGEVRKVRFAVSYGHPEEEDYEDAKKMLRNSIRLVNKRIEEYSMK